MDRKPHLIFATVLLLCAGSGPTRAQTQDAATSLASQSAWWCRSPPVPPPTFWAD